MSLVGLTHAKTEEDRTAILTTHKSIIDWLKDGAPGTLEVKVPCNMYCTCWETVKLVAHFPYPDTAVVYDLDDILDELREPVFYWHSTDNALYSQSVSYSWHALDDEDVPRPWVTFHDLLEKNIEREVNSPGFVDSIVFGSLLYDAGYKDERTAYEQAEKYVKSDEDAPENMPLPIYVPVTPVVGQEGYKWYALIVHDLNEALQKATRELTENSGLLLCKELGTFARAKEILTDTQLVQRWEDDERVYRQVMDRMLDAVIEGAKNVAIEDESGRRYTRPIADFYPRTWKDLYSIVRSEHILPYALAGIKRITWKRKVLYEA